MAQAPNVTGSCQPVDAGDGLLTLACAGVISNPGPQKMIVAVVGVVPGQQAAQVQEYTLFAGMSTTLPAPPAGGFWVIGYETQSQIRWQNGWALAGGIGFSVLAGIGAYDVLAAIFHPIAHRSS